MDARQKLFTVIGIKGRQGEASGVFSKQMGMGEGSKDILGKEMTTPRVTVKRRREDSM